jgi:hypothetical protein
MNGPSMTTPPTNPPYQPWPPQPTPPAVPPKRKSRVGLIVGIVAGAVILLVVLLGIIGAALAGNQSAGKTPSVTTPTEFHGAPLVEPDPTTEPAVAAGPVLTADEVKLSLKTTSKQCFGSAGCNVEVKVEMKYDGEPLSASDTWEVTYSITGGDDGETIGSFDVTGDQYDVNSELLSTASSKTKLHVKVTGVDKIGI